MANKYKPGCGSVSRKGRYAKMIVQPRARYAGIERISNCAGTVNYKMIPTAAIAQMPANIFQPRTPRTHNRAKGVNVPAIITKIAE